VNDIGGSPYLQVASYLGAGRKLKDAARRINCRVNRAPGDEPGDASRQRD
jgi:hypothetical protein